MPSSRHRSQFAPPVIAGTVHSGIALGAFIASLCVALPSAAQQGMGGSGGGGGTGGSGTGGSGTGGGGGSGGSSMTGSGGSADDPGAECVFAEQPECPDRCPMYASCVVSTGGQDLRAYFRVEEQRFECDGLACDPAATQLADYCCRRGEFAPSDEDGGCTLSPGGLAAGGSSSESLAPWLGLALCATSVGLYRRHRARRQ